MGVCWCTVDRVRRHSYPQITLYWASGRQRGHEIIQRRAMCSSDRDTEGVTLLPSLPPALPAALPVYHTAFHRGLSHPCMHSIVQLLLIPFILLLCCFLPVCVLVLGIWSCRASLPPSFVSPLIFFLNPAVICNLLLSCWDPGTDMRKPLIFLT